MSDGSVSQLIGQLSKEDSREAQSEIFRRYYPRLVEQLSRRLSNVNLRAVDAEDIAASAMQAILLGASQNRFAQLKTRDNLWALLLTIARRKASNQLRRRQPRGDSAVFSSGGPTSPQASQDPASDLLLQELLEKLSDDDLRLIAVLRLEGHSNQEIAALINRSVKTVERRNQLIRKTWENEFDE